MTGWPVEEKASSNSRLPHPAADTQMWWCQAALSTVGWQLHSKQ